MFRLKTRIPAPHPGTIQLGQTLPSLLDEVCDRHPNPHALQQWVNNHWRSLSNQAFRRSSEELALGLIDLSVTKDKPVTLFMHSDINFCLADMACLLAGLVNVPIDPGLNSEAIQFILRQTESAILITSNLELLNQIIPYLKDLPALKTIIVADVAAESPQLPGLQIIPLERVQARGQAQWSEKTLQQLREAIAPTDTATIVYTTATNGQPKGVMLSHASLAGNILSSFSGIPELQPGKPEVALLFLPLTHIFARVFLYGHLYYSHQVYFTTPNWVSKHLREVKPTIFITVPRLLEKAQEKIVEQGAQLRGIRRCFFNWAMHLAQRYDLEHPPKGLYALQLRLANRLVFPQWRAGFGGRVKYLISGGAALKAELANLFTAAKIPVFQGYGLTESGSALCSNHVGLNRAGTVGIPIAGVSIAIAPDGEILAKTPYGMQGYYKDPAATKRAIDPEGWLHTGDLGELSEGFLKITGHKKNLFKLSTGKYVAPQPIEQQLKRSPFVKQAIVIGAQRKFCTLLLFPDLDYLCPQAEGMCLALPIEKMLKHSKITALYQTLIDEANQHLPHWSTIKRFRLLHLTLTLEEGMQKPTLTIKRDTADQIFAAEIEALYRENIRREKPQRKPQRPKSQPAPKPALNPAEIPLGTLEDAQPVPIPIPSFLNAFNARFLRVRGGSNHV
jgi:long-chain acyl-CoA synthetase